jgi:hypothetical protein
VRITTPVGRYLSYDAEAGDWRPPRPIGTLALSNCSCGDTIGLSTDDMAMPLRLELLEWVKLEAQRRGVSPPDLLDRLRVELRRQLLAESEESA